MSFAKKTPRARFDAAPLMGGAALMLLCIIGLLALTRAGTATAGTGGMESVPSLPSVRAAGIQVDTLFVGGYAQGSFTDALSTLASELTQGERAMVGRHLDRIYRPVLGDSALGAGGRLRLAYERVRRPDGSTRAIQVLAAEAAVRGSLHTVFLFEEGENPGYYDDLGRSLDPAPWSGPLPAMQVTSPFRMDRMHPILRRVLPHTGVDLAAGLGTPVHATADGVISYAAPRGGYGNLVEVQHPNGLTTRYAHLSSVAGGVLPGRGVRQGEVVGYVGATGLATGPHLHYEVRQRGQPVDPMRVQASASSSHDVGYDPGWREDRRGLARLLARAPRILSARR
jgi:murein DD-endopeptidase MepM/ murein hydrolase activator NlpD